MPDHRSPCPPADRLDIGKWARRSRHHCREGFRAPVLRGFARVHPARHGSLTGTASEVRAALTASMPGEAAEGPKNHPELSALADVLANVRRWSDTDSEMRSLKPWIEDWSADAWRFMRQSCATCPSPTGPLRATSMNGWKPQLRSSRSRTVPALPRRRGKLQRRVQLRRLRCCGVDARSGRSYRGQR